MNAQRWAPALLAATNMAEAIALVVDQAQRRLKGVKPTLLWTLDSRSAWSQSPGHTLSLGQFELVQEVATARRTSSIGFVGDDSALAQCAVSGDARVVLLCTPDNDAVDFSARRADCEIFFAAMCPYLVDALEKARLYASVERLEQSEKLQRALFAIAELASSELEMPKMLSGLHQIVSSLMYAENFYIALHDPIADAIRFLYFADIVETEAPDLEVSLPMTRFERGLTWYLIRDRHPLMGTHEQMREQVSGPLHLRGTDSLDWLGVPMIRGTTVYGVLVVQNYADRPRYTAQDQALLSFVGSHILTALERKHEHHELRQQRAEMEAVNDCSPLGLFRTDSAGLCIYINQAYERISGLRAEEALALGWDATIHPDDQAQVKDEWEYAMRSHAGYTGMVRFLHANRRVVWAAVRTAPVMIDVDVVGHVGSVDDVTARRDVEDALRLSERRIRTIADAVPAMVGYVDADLRFVFANAQYARSYGCPTTEIVGKTLAEVVGETIYARRQPYIERAQGGEQQSFEDEDGVGSSRRSLQLTYIPQFDEDDADVLGIHIMANDITATKHREHQLIQLAERDSLTGLANRVGFMSRLVGAMERSGEQQMPMAVIYLDVDHFKSINDTHGHAVGDALLLAFAGRLSVCVRASDVVSRLGGDEFSVIAEGIRSPEYAAAKAEKIVSVMRSAFVLESENLTLSISVSVGLALNMGTDISPDELLKRADAALYRAKDSGRNAYAITNAA